MVNGNLYLQVHLVLLSFDVELVVAVQPAEVIAGLAVQEAQSQHIHHDEFDRRPKRQPDP